MIPKKLHYVWLGGNQIPEEYQNYIDGWAKMMPDWEIVRWDETVFDVNCSSYCKQAYEAKRWAFVSDYVRVKVLYDEGGVYLDTDEEMVRPLDQFTEHSAVFGMESGLKLQAGMFGCEPRSAVIGKILEYYNSINYIENSKQNNAVIGLHFENVLRKIYPNFRLCEEIQMLGNGVVVYPSDYFCPDIKKPLTNPNTHTIHHYAGTWLSKGQRMKIKFNDFIGDRNAKMLSKIKKCLKNIIKK